jgi:hypothetical protein
MPPDWLGGQHLVKSSQSKELAFGYEGRTVVSQVVNSRLIDLTFDFCECIAGDITIRLVDLTENWDQRFTAFSVVLDGNSDDIYQVVLADF